MLKGLITNRNETLTILEKMPISLPTLSSINKKNILEKKLDDIENNIKIYSKKKVFVKI